jgi:hypothetical protein
MGFDDMVLGTPVGRFANHNLRFLLERGLRGFPARGAGVPLEADDAKADANGLPLKSGTYYPDK